MNPFGGNKLMQYMAVALMSYCRKVLIWADTNDDVLGAIFVRNTVESAQLFVVVDNVEVAASLSELGLSPIYLESERWRGVSCRVPGEFDLIVNRTTGADEFVVLESDSGYRSEYPEILSVFGTEGAFIITGSCKEEPNED